LLTRFFLRRVLRVPRVVVLWTTTTHPAAATRFSATPTHVVARRPMAGMRKKPAAIAPLAAPAVVTA
jgi:hypothetical protein